MSAPAGRISYSEKKGPLFPPGMQQRSGTSKCFRVCENIGWPAWGAYASPAPTDSRARSSSGLLTGATAQMQRRAPPPAPETPPIPCNGATLFGPPSQPPAEPVGIFEASACKWPAAGIDASAASAARAGGGGAAVTVRPIAVRAGGGTRLSIPSTFPPGSAHLPQRPFAAQGLSKTIGGVPAGAASAPGRWAGGRIGGAPNGRPEPDSLRTAASGLLSLVAPSTDPREAAKAGAPVDAKKAAASGALALLSLAADEVVAPPSGRLVFARSAPKERPPAALPASALPAPTAIRSSAPVVAAAALPSRPMKKVSLGIGPALSAARAGALPPRVGPNGANGPSLLLMHLDCRRTGSSYFPRIAFSFDDASSPSAYARGRRDATLEEHASRQSRASLTRDCDQLHRPDEANGRLSASSMLSIGNRSGGSAGSVGDACSLPSRPPTLSRVNSLASTDSRVGSPSDGSSIEGREWASVASSEAPQSADNNSLPTSPFELDLPSTSGFAPAEPQANAPLPARAAGEVAEFSAPPAKRQRHNELPTESAEAGDAEAAAAEAAAATRGRRASHP